MEEDIEKRKDSIKKKLSSLVKDNYDKIFLVVLVVAFVIRLLIFLKTAQQPLWWDEADYLSASKKWAGLNSSLGDIWYYRRGFLWPAIGALFFALGIGEISMRFLIVLLSTGIVALTYYVVAKMFDKKIALLTSIMVVFSWVSLFFTGRVLTDIPATFFLLIALLFFWKGYVLKEGNKFLYLFGVFFALSLLTRFQFAMFAIPFFVFIFLREKWKFVKNRHIWITVGLALAVLFPFFILYWMHYGNVFTDILSHYFGVSGVSNTETIHRTTANLFMYFKDLPYILTTSILVLFLAGIIVFFQDMILGIDKIFKNEEVQKKFFIFVWILTPFLILGYITDYVEQRYILSALPFIFLIASSALIKLGDVVVKSSKISRKTIYILSIILLLFFLIIPLGSVSSNYSAANSLIDNKLTSYKEIQQAGEWIKTNSDSSDIVITQSRPQIVYYAERSVQNDSHIFDNVSYFENAVKELNAKYLVLSSYEQSPDWIYAYPQNNSGKITPVQAYYQDKNPVVIIYEFQRS